MNPRILSEAKTLSVDAFRAAHERFVARTRLESACACPRPAGTGVYFAHHHYKDCPAKAKESQCAGEPDGGWRNAGPCSACTAKEAA